MLSLAHLDAALLRAQRDGAGIGRDRHRGSGAQHAEARAARLDHSTGALDAQHAFRVGLVVGLHPAAGQLEPVHPVGDLADGQLRGLGDGQARAVADAQVGARAPASAQGVVRAQVLAGDQRGPGPSRGAALDGSAHRLDDGLVDRR